MTRIARWWRTARWPVIGAIAAGVMVLGTVGFDRHLHDGGVNPSIFDSVYRSIQLFVLEWGGVDAPVPVPLEVARFLAPFVAGLAAVQAAAVVFREEIDRLWVRLFRRDHVIVCGVGDRGAVLSRALARGGRRVVTIDPMHQSTGTERGITALEGDATDPAILIRAGVKRARHLVTLGPSDSVNAAIVRVAQRLGSERLAIHVHVDDARLAALLRTETLMAEGTSGPTVEFFDLGEGAARSLLDSCAAIPRSVLVVGCGPLADRIPIEMARRVGDRREVTILGRRSGEFVDELEDRHPGLGETVALGAVETPVGRAATHVASVVPPDLIVLAMADESAALTIGLEVAQVLKSRSADGRVVDIVMTSDRHGSLAGLVAGTVGGEAAIRFRSFDALGGVLTPALLDGGVVEALARAIHAGYRGRAPGDPDPSPPDLPAWAELGDLQRDASRAAAGAIGKHLRAIGCDLVPLSAVGPAPLELTPAEVELIAILEHERWVEWKRARGFELGTPRAGRKNPYMLPWFDLDEVSRDRVASAIARLPAVLAGAGQQVVRLDRSPARVLHEGYVARRIAAGDTEESNPAMAPWDRLAETLRASNRDQVAHLRVKLRAIGCDLAPGPGPALILSDTDIERLAEMEHERWVRHRLFDGWTLGPTKDVEGKASPHLVPWSELGETMREVDREFVRSMPDLIATMGSHIVVRT